MTRSLAALLILAGCGDTSRIEPPEPSPVDSPSDVEVRDVQVSGAQSPKIAGLYLNQACARAARFCSPPAGSSADLTMTIDRGGTVAEVGLRPDRDFALECVRDHLERQRFPRVKGRTLVSARVTFREPGDVKMTPRFRGPE